LLRSKECYLRNIYNERGKKIGVIKDIFIDFNNKKVIGFKVSSFSPFRKNDFLDIEDIIQFKKKIIVKELKSGEYLKFSDIKDMEVIDNKGIIRGDIEDIIFEEESYCIKGLIISPGIIEKIIKGKEIILMSHTVLEEGNVVYYGDETIIFKNIPRKVKNNEFQ